MQTDSKEIKTPIIDLRFALKTWQSKRGVFRLLDIGYDLITANKALANRVNNCTKWRMLAENHGI